MNTTLQGNTLETAVFEYFSKQLAEGRLPWTPEFCKIFRQKGYYSRDRDSDIKFDVSIELYMPGASEYSMVWLIECKNYSSSVSVDNVEEFFAKVQQVGPANAKAIMISNCPFAAGGMNFARSKKMGIIRYFDSSNVKWELYRSPSASATPAEEADNSSIMRGITSADFKSSVFDLYMQGPNCLTNSLWEFANHLLADSTLKNGVLTAMRSGTCAPTRVVPYLSQEDLENKSFSCLCDGAYEGGMVSLDEICFREAKRNGLRVISNVIQQPHPDRPPKLGQISFSSLEITIYQQTRPNIGRERFTLAHELAHHLLAHGDYMSNESCDEQDFTLHHDSNVLGVDVSRMERQANIFASCLLMPQSEFMGNFRRITKWLGIRNKGFGELYLDGQACNFRDYSMVIGELVNFYNVSRTAASIRLSSLGLLNDVRSKYSEILE